MQVLLRLQRIRSIREISPRLTQITLSASRRSIRATGLALRLLQLTLSRRRLLRPRTITVTNINQILLRSLHRSSRRRRVSTSLLNPSLSSPHLASGIRRLNPRLRQLILSTLHRIRGRRLPTTSSLQILLRAGNTHRSVFILRLRSRHLILSSDNLRRGRIALRADILQLLLGDSQLLRGLRLITPGTSQRVSRLLDLTGKRLTRRLAGLREFLLELLTRLTGGAGDLLHDSGDKALHLRVNGNPNATSHDLDLQCLE